MICRENQKTEREQFILYREKSSQIHKCVKLSNNPLGFSLWKKRAILVANLNPREQG